jgi:cell division protein FtsZ
MATGKRASMREGPLAALFRKTEEDGVEPEAAAPEAPPAKQGRGSAPATPAARRRAAEPPSHPRDTGYPHPSLAADAPSAPEAPSRVPTPQERLRHAFSTDIPEDIMERPARRRVAAGDPYARQQEDAVPWGEARPAGRPILRVIGVGGAGVNAVNRMVEAEVRGVEFLAINTDLQSLQQSTADVTLHIGPNITRGLGAGSNPDLGRAAAMEEYDRIKALLKGSDMVFIAAGAGGGTGTGAAPVVARIARELGALTVGIATKPFGFEGSRRAGTADQGIQALADEVDTLIVVPNNKLLSVLDKQTSMVDAFRVADDVLRQGVQGISDLVTLPGLINLDFADVRTIMCDAGNALLGIGMGTGEDRAVDAAHAAISSPLLETSMEGARKILLSITGGPDLSLWEINEAAKAVSEAAHPDANIIFGAMVDDKLGSEVWVTVVATSYGPSRSRRVIEEPQGEPRIQRRTPPALPPREPEHRSRLGVDMDVPEFVPRR